MYVCAGSGSSDDEEEGSEEGEEEEEKAAPAIPIGPPPIGVPPPPPPQFAEDIAFAMAKLREYYQVRTFGQTHLCACVAVCTLVRVPQDMTKWEPASEKDGVKTYVGKGILASARGDGIIPFPVK